MTPGSYWSMPAKLEHVSSCAPGADCVMYIWQKTKFDFLPGKEDKVAGSAAAPAAAPVAAKAAAPAAPAAPKAAAPAAPAAAPAKK
jgi:hypothetical protein